MQRLQRISQRELAATEPLPDVLGLARKFPGAYFRRGQTVLLAAEPNNGKSPLVLWHCVQWALLGLRVLYFSSDTDEYVTWKRAAACVLDQPTAQVEQMSKAKTSAGLGRLGGRLSFSFETDPSYKDVMEEMVAFFELWGQYPDVVVVDLLADIQGDNEDEYGRLREHTQAFKRLARATDSCVIMVHHVNEEDSSKRKGEIVPPARGRITGKISKKPEMVLTIAYDGDAQLMKVAPVKFRDNTEGTDDTGRKHLAVRSDPTRMQFYELQSGERLGADRIHSGQRLGASA